MNLSRTILVTAFEPFGGEDTNASLEALTALPDKLADGTSVVKLVLPVVFGRCGQVLLEGVTAHCPEVILSLGMAAGRDRITPEVFAVNARYATLPDNAGQVYTALSPIFPDGAAAYRSTLPVQEMVTRLQENGIAAGLSFSAGSYVCNDLFYALMELATVPAGFVHVPQSLEKAQAGRPGMAQEMINCGVRILVEMLMGIE